MFTKGEADNMMVKAFIKNPNVIVISFCTIG